MEIIVVFAIAAALGALLVVSPLHDSARVGVVLAPATCILGTVALWSALLWVGAPAESALMWVVPLLFGMATAFAVSILVSGARERWSRRRFAELVRG